MEKNPNPCVFCEYARMRRDICGIYYTGEFFKMPDGTCKHFREYKSRRKSEKAEVST